MPPSPLDAFMKADVDSVLKVPDNLPPAWQTFFDKVKGYYVKVCQTTSPLGLEWIGMEKRAWQMQDDGLNEFDMLVSAAQMKEKGNVAFKAGDFENAFMYYISAVNAFPTPDSMLNAAACSLKDNRFDSAETLCSQALSMDLLSDPSKALYRRAQARRRQGKVKEALQDIQLAIARRPGDKLIQEELKEIERLTKMKPAKLASYVASQPKPPEKMSWTAAMGRAGQLDARIIKLPPYMDMRKVDSPTF